MRIDQLPLIVRILPLKRLVKSLPQRSIGIHGSAELATMLQKTLGLVLFFFVNNE